MQNPPDPAIDYCWLVLFIQNLSIGPNFLVSRINRGMIRLIINKQQRKSGNQRMTI